MEATPQMPRATPGPRRLPLSAPPPSRRHRYLWKTHNGFLVCPCNWSGCVMMNLFSIQTTAVLVFEGNILFAQFSLARRFPGLRKSHRAFQKPHPGFWGDANFPVSKQICGLLLSFYLFIALSICLFSRYVLAYYDKTSLLSKWTHCGILRHGSTLFYVTCLRCYVQACSFLHPWLQQTLGFNVAFCWE